MQMNSEKIQEQQKVIAAFSHQLSQVENRLVSLKTKTKSFQMLFESLVRFLVQNLGLEHFWFSVVKQILSNK